MLGKAANLRRSNNYRGSGMNGSYSEDDSEQNEANFEANDGFFENLESDEEKEQPRYFGVRQHKKEFRKIAEEREFALIKSIYQEYVSTFLNDDNGIEYDDSEFSEYITRLTNDGSYNAPGTFSLSSALRIVLLGPKKSGKSAMLKMIAKRTYKNLIQLGESREVFMLFMDFRDIKKSFDSFSSLLEMIINSLVDQLPVQFPLLRTKPPKEAKPKKFNKNGNINLIREFFMQFVNFNGNFEPLSSKFIRNEPFNAIANAINNLGKSIADAALDKKTPKRFLNQIALLPQNLASIFGFKQVLYLFDHLDEADFDVPAIRGRVNISSFLKQMLNSGQFIISCTDDEHIYNVCEAIDEDDIDLITSSSFESILDSYNSPPTCKFYFELKFQGIPKPIPMQIEDCGACSGYVTKWNKIVETIKPVISKSGQENSPRDIEKARIKGLLLLRQLAPLILLDQDSKSQSYNEINSTLESYEIIFPK